MRLRHIEVFHAVYTAGSITAAARLLNVSQPSVSKVLAHAEMQLGFPLFDRIRGKIVPTREAEMLIGHVTDAYDILKELRRVARNLGSADKGIIRIAATPAFGIELVPKVIATYLGRHPDTRFEIESLHHRQVARALRELRIDIGLVFDPHFTADIRTEHLATAEFVALTHASMGFDGRRHVSLEELSDKPFINLSTRSPLGMILDHRIENSGTRFEPVATVETYQLAKGMVAHGAGVSLVDEITARSSGSDGVVATRLDPPLHFKVTLAHLESEPLSIVTQRFVEHLKAELREFMEKPLNG